MQVVIRQRAGLGLLGFSLLALAIACFGLTKPAAAAAAARKRTTVMTPTFRDISYGPHQAQVLDFWQAKSTEPTPVLIFFHGGGFVKGDKSGIMPDLLAACLANGISVASANYRLMPEARFPDLMMDGARVVQFIRSQAEAWRINPEKIALSGGSAGANISLWLALHDDLADPAAVDPILRQSTRVSAVLAFNGQTSNDPWFIIKNIGGGLNMHPSLYGFYNVSSLEEMKEPGKQKLASEASAINYATPDDPPMYLVYNSRLLAKPHPANAPVGEVIHSPRFGLFLKERLDALGVECQFHHQGHPSSVKDQVAFLLRHLRPDSD